MTRNCLRVLSFLLLATACAHQAPQPSAWAPLAEGGVAPPLLTACTPIGDGKAVEQAFDAAVLLGSEQDLTAWLQVALHHLDPADLAGSPSVRRFALHAVVRLVRSGGFSERFADIRQAVDAMQAAAPDAAETIFARAFLRIVLMTDAGGHLHLGNLERQIGLDLQRDLQHLVQAYPDFDGPGQFDRRAIASLQRQAVVMLAESPTAAVAPAAAATPELDPAQGDLPTADDQETP